MPATVVIAVLIGLLHLTPPGASRQEVDLEHLDETLPSADLFGNAWSHSNPYSLPDNSSFRETQVATYWGPYGGRAFVYLVAPNGSMANQRVAWARMVNAVDAVEQYTLQDQTDTTYELSQQRGTEGCNESYRAEGIDPIDTYPTGATLCDSGKGFFIYVMVSGELKHGSQKYELHEASDAIVSAMLGYGPLAQFSATPPA